MIRTFPIVNIGNVHLRGLLFLLVPGLVLQPAFAAPKDKDADWALASAPYRVVLHAAGPPTAADAGWEIRLPDFGGGRNDLRDIVLLDDKRKEIALDCIWRGAGRSLLVLAQSMPGDGAAATLYFGGTTALRMRDWPARRSLLLETRRLPQGANVATFAGWQEAWKKALVVDGVGFVPMIFQGENPFGESGRFMSRFTGRLKTGDGGPARMYTLSNDVSYVIIDGHAALKWQGNDPPPVQPEKVPAVALNLTKGSVAVEYLHAVGDPPAAMVLGWDRSGKLGNIPPEAWEHPGKVNAGAPEAHDGAPVPLANLEAQSYLGFGGEWFVRVNGKIAEPGDGWQVEWLWPDGHLDHGPEMHRVWPGLEPVHVVLRLRNGPRMIEGRRMMVIPRELEAASVNNARQLAGFLELLDKEDPGTLAEPARRAGFVLAKAFQPPSTAVRWAEAWLGVAQPGGETWLAAMTLAIREAAKRDPKAALDRLANLPPPARAAMGHHADLLELDLRVFGLKDPMVVGLAGKLRKSGDRKVATMAQVRLGDYHLLNGRVDEAVRCYGEAVPVREATAGKAPVIDRASSLAIEELLDGKNLDEARAKLDEWELHRPGAKIEADQLLWRARVMMLAEDWNRALQDLETCLKVRPGAPEEIDVLFWQGRALYELGRKEDARKIWNSLSHDYPKHERAEAAKLWAGKS